MDVPGVAQVLNQSLPAGRLHGLHADVGPSAAVAGAGLEAQGSFCEGAVVLIPDGQRDRGQPLEVLIAQDLLAGDVDIPPELCQLRQGMYVMEHHPFGVGGAAHSDVGEQRSLPVGVRRLLGPMAPPQPGSVKTLPNVVLGVYGAGHTSG